MNKSEEASWPILRLIEWTTSYLADKGAESPRLDAEVLLASVRQCSRIELYTAFNEVADEATRAAYKSLVQRRAAGEPVAYLVGFREFYSRDFKVTPAVLIPRPETEFVVIAALDFVSDRGLSGSLRMADIGTGSGNVGITLAKENPSWNVVAIDIQPDALEIARQNVAHHAVDEQMELRCGPYYAQESETVLFDIVVSNPPYVTSNEYDDLPATVRDYEPKIALVGGDRGTEVIEQLIEESTPRVRPEGALVVEISPMLEADVTALIEQHALWQLHKVYKDHAGHSRVIVAIRA